MQLNYYTENDQWMLQKPITLALEKTDWYDRTFDLLTITIRMKRRSRFYKVAVVSPFALLYAVSGEFHPNFLLEVNL